MSLFDSIFSSRAAPVLMGHMAQDPKQGVSATITLGDVSIRDVTCILRHEVTIDEEDNGRIVKRREKEVDFATDDSLTWKGMEGAWTNAKVTLHYPARHGSPACDEVWGVQQVRNRTDTFIRLILIRKTAREFSRSGLRREPA